jgi:hypothetical protein
MFPQAGIHDGTTVKLALQPLVNLARPQILDGDADAACEQHASIVALAR